MGEIVFAAAMSHAPYIGAFPDAPPAAQRKRFFDAARELRDRLAIARPDVLIVIAPDHFSNFFLDHMPGFFVGLNERYQGPMERWIKIDQTIVPGAYSYARDLLTTAFSSGFEPAFGEGLTLEHGVMIPLSLLTPGYDIPIVWVMQNCQMPPMPSLRRCYEFGTMIRSVIDRREERVAIIGTGGLSHSPGAPEAEDLDEAFDRYFLSLLDAGDDEAILNIPSDRLDKAGFGTWEIRQWVTTMGAVRGRRGRSLAYEPVKEWDTGCAVAVFE
jgi:aromatic ring-opening dioxygenase LigB subunit